MKKNIHSFVCRHVNNNNEKMEEEKRNHNNFFPYPSLVLNPLDFVLKLCGQKEYTKDAGGFMPGFAIYLLIEECEEVNAYVGKYIHTYTGENNEHLIGKRVRFTFQGLKGVGEKEFGEKEDVGDKMLMYKQYFV